MERLIRKVELEDVTSPRHAYYSISLKALAEGYSVETSWGAATGCKKREVYYRSNLSEAISKFECIIASKTSVTRRRQRHYILKEAA